MRVNLDVMLRVDSLLLEVPEIELYHYMLFSDLPGPGERFLLAALRDTVSLCIYPTMMCAI